MTNRNAWKKITLQNHPTSLVLNGFRFVRSRYGRGVLLLGEDGQKYVCWSTVVVDQFEDLERWIAQGNDLQLPRPIYFYVIKSGMGRDYLMVSSKPHEESA
jgi:hypothetical protein